MCMVVVGWVKVVFGSCLGLLSVVCCVGMVFDCFVFLLIVGS